VDGVPGDDAGKLLSLLDLIDEYGEALEYDLLEMGYRLRWVYDGTNDFTWRDLWVIVRHLPRTSALQRAVQGDEAVEWTVSDYLLASIVDAQNWLVWSKTKDAQGRIPRNRPKPVRRPGDKDESEKISGDVLPAEEMCEFLGGDFLALVA